VRFLRKRFHFGDVENAPLASMNATESAILVFLYIHIADASGRGYKKIIPLFSASLSRTSNPADVSHSSMPAGASHIAEMEPFFGGSGTLRRRGSLCAEMNRVGSESKVSRLEIASKD